MVGFNDLCTHKVSLKNMHSQYVNVRIRDFTCFTFYYLIFHIKDFCTLRI